MFISANFVQNSARSAKTAETSPKSRDSASSAVFPEGLFFKTLLNISRALWLCPLIHSSLALSIKGSFCSLQEARRKIESQKKTVPEGSLEWDVLYRKYYAEELKKL